MAEKKTVLIADDDPALRKGMQTKLQSSGFECKMAADGEEAINVALEEHPDLIIMDQLMPKFTGLAAIKRIRADFDWGRHVPIIVMTNVAEGTSAHRELLLVSNRYFVKSNTSLDELVNTVKEMVGGDNSEPDDSGGGNGQDQEDSPGPDDQPG